MRMRHRTSVMAIGLCLLAGSAAAVTAQDEAAPMAPAEFSGHIVCGADVSPGTTEESSFETTGGVARSWVYRGSAWNPSATMSDPRLEGTYTIRYDWDEYRLPGASELIRLGSATWRIENDAGAWEGSLTNGFLSDRSTATGSGVLVGEDAYEGLAVIWEETVDWAGCDWDVRGLIVEGSAPATPEAVVVE